MKLDIVTPLGRIFEGEIKEVVLPGIEGEFGVLEGHSPLTTILQPGLIVVKKADGNEEALAVNGGFVEVSPNRVNVLADVVQPIKGSTSTEIAEAIEKAKKIIKEASDSDALVASVEARIENVGRNL
jgi:F-type H+-transporting ATPase subunit epsilon